jgi:hypothetical protein
VLAVALATAACAVVAGIDPVNYRATNEADVDAETADTIEAGGPLDDAETSTDTGPRKNSCGGLLFGTSIPLSNGDFELGCANGWGTWNATTSDDTTTTSKGSIACRVCYTSGDFGFYVKSTVTRPVVPGENYEVVACVRALPGADGGVYVYPELFAGGDGVVGDGVNAGATYVPIRTAWDVTVAQPSLAIDVRSPGVPGSCFLVDDVSLAIVRDAGSD